MRIIDPPSGWQYGFPKPIPDDIKDVKPWLVENGYPQSLIDELGEYFFCRYWDEVDEEYPELEGTNALCEDIIKKRTGKMTEEEWVAAERGEISDEEIEKAAEKETCYMSDFIKGAKWYREQLKQRAK